MDNDKNSCGRTITLISQYLANYAPPSLLADKDFILKSTEDIICELADMADLSPNDVADAMLSLGFFFVRREGLHGWAMKPK